MALFALSFMLFSDCVFMLGINQEKGAIWDIYHRQGALCKPQQSLVYTLRLMHTKRPDYHSNTFLSEKKSQAENV